MKIPVYSSTIRRSEMDAVLTCMVEEKIGPGEMAQNLMKLAGEVFQVSGAVVFRSPSVALSYALEALNLEEGAKVVISALAPSWQYTELIRKKYTPIVLDVQPDVPVISVESVEDAVRNGARLIIFHETVGCISGLDKIINLGIPVIEDISQSAGGKYLQRFTGNNGVFSILGLEEKDILTGGGGAVLLAPERRNYSVLKKLYESAPSTDLLPDINASLAFIQLKQLEKNIKARQEIYEIYLHALAQGKHKPINYGYEQTADNPVYSFPILLASGAAEVKKYAIKKNVETEFAFTDSVVAALADEQDSFLNSVSFLLRCVLFPLYPRLGSKNAVEISKVLATLP